MCITIIGAICNTTVLIRIFTIYESYIDDHLITASLNVILAKLSCQYKMYFTQRKVRPVCG